MMSMVDTLVNVSYMNVNNRKLGNLSSSGWSDVNLQHLLLGLGSGALVRHRSTRRSHSFSATRNKDEMSTKHGTHTGTR